MKVCEFAQKKQRAFPAACQRLPEPGHDAGAPPRIVIYHHAIPLRMACRWNAAVAYSLHPGAEASKRADKNGRHLVSRSQHNTDTHTLLIVAPTRSIRRKPRTSVSSQLSRALPVRHGKRRECDGSFQRPASADELLQCSNCQTNWDAKRSDLTSSAGLAENYE